MVISYEIDETSLRRVSSISYERITSVRFCLSFDSLKIGFYLLQNGQYFKKKKLITDTDVVSDVTFTRQCNTRVVIRFL